MTYKWHWANFQMTSRMKQTLAWKSYRKCEITSKYLDQKWCWKDVKKMTSRKDIEMMLRIWCWYGVSGRLDIIWHYAPTGTIHNQQVLYNVRDMLSDTWCIKAIVQIIQALSKILSGTSFQFWSNNFETRKA